MKRSVVLAALTLLILFYVQPAFSQTAEEMKTLKEEVKSLKEGQTAIQKDLQEIKNLLRAKQMPPAQPEFKEAVINISGGHTRGNQNAKLALIEFSDYQ